MSDATLQHVIESRKSIRHYTGEPIPDEHVREIVRLASLAPSTMNLQPWRLVVVREHQAKQQLMAASMNQAQVGAADTVFVVYSDMLDTLETLAETVHPNMEGERAERALRSGQGYLKGLEPTEMHHLGNGMAYIFLGFLLLAARSMGYGTSAMLGFHPEQVRELYGLPAHAKIAAVVAMGVPANEGYEHHRHSVDRIARFV